MVINERNSSINSFIKGMNSDTAFDQISNEQYIFGLNVRVTKNQLIGSLGNSNDYSSVHEGIIAPVPAGVDVTLGTKAGRIISVASIEQLGIIVSTTNHDINVYKFYVDETTNTVSGFKLVWHADNVWTKGNAPTKISTVLYKELENVIKLYIATGEHPIISLRVDDESDGKYQNTSIDDLINNRILPQERIKIEDVTSGRLTTSQVLYTYRYYNKYGNTTLLAPLTNKIQVIDPNRSKESGNAENTETSIGFSLSINISEYKNEYDRILVYRLLYIIPGLNAEVSLIYDGKIKESSTNTFSLNDVGIDPLQKLSMEEFAAMSGLILVPLIIEQNQEYMFCANVKDDTIIQGASISNSKIDTVKALVVLSDKINGDIPSQADYYYNQGLYNQLTGSDSTVSDYFEQRGINPELVTASYENIFTSSLLRSLRRGETYKYAIVFYDKYGRRTDVLGLGDKDVDDYNTSRPFAVENGKLVANPIGVKIHIPTLSLPQGYNLSDIIGCQIVRRTSSEIYQKTLLLVALARPIQLGLLDINITDESEISEDTVKKSPYYPSAFLSVSGLQIKKDYYDLEQEHDCLYAKTNNHRLYQIFSSEIDFRRNDVLSRLNISNTTISEMLYIPSVFAEYENSNKIRYYIGDFPGAGQELYDVSDGGPIDTAPLVRFDAVTPHTVTAGSVQPTNADYTSTYVTGGDGDTWFYIDPSHIDTAKEVRLTFDSADVSRLKLLYIDHTLVGGTNEDHYVYGPNVKVNEDITKGGTLIFVEQALNGSHPLYAVVDSSHNATQMTISVRSRHNSDNQEEGYLDIDKTVMTALTMDKKLHTHWIFDFFLTVGPTHSEFHTNDVNQIKDVKIPNWDSGFVDIQRDEDLKVATAIKKYKSFLTNIDSFTYNNWASFCKYDLRPGVETQPNVWDSEGGLYELLGTYDEYRALLNVGGRRGWIGPGPSCFLLTTKEETDKFPLYEPRFYTSICNIQHNPKITEVESDDFTQYYGFGNYFNLSYNSQTNNLLCNGKEDLIVFDGDVYITPHEFTTIYKAYDFNSVDTLQSMQVTNYVPLESKVNTYLDYGRNLRNTESENLIYEPGHIDGVTTQDRPAHQYNMIYSDNDSSNDIFTLISTDKDETNQFKQRAYYSDLKTNGEFIDNFLIFKPASFIDVDSKYGLITNLLTDRNNLYYWQDYACGRFSVNERSLVNDQNSNTIMLGQAGILSRYDYISTKYGMRLHDFCARSTEGGVFWVDINNKAIAALAENKAINYGEQVGVQNIINHRITSDVPNVDYDLQNDELLCKCFGNDQIVFNIKYNAATSLYTRLYDRMLYIKNHIFGLHNTLNYMTRYNYLAYANQNTFLYPLLLSFIVNPSASVTKVFDSQQFIPIKRDVFTAVDNTQILSLTKMSFETDIVKKAYGNSMEPYTDREGNIIYNIPRYTTGDGYGNRIRGKWMRVNIDNANPTEYFTISHIITKFRQSFS